MYKRISKRYMKIISSFFFNREICKLQDHLKEYLAHITF